MALSMDLRKRIIEAYENGEGSIRALAKRFKAGFATIWRLLKRYRIKGELTPMPPGRNSKIDKTGLKLMEKLMTKKQAIALNELAQALAGQQAVQGQPHGSASRLPAHGKAWKQRNLFAAWFAWFITD